MSYGIHISLDPGSLDTPVTLKTRSTSVKNALNEETITYASNEVMGMFQYLSGSETTEAGKETTFLKAKLIIRYYPGLTTEDYVVNNSDDSEWDIETIGMMGKKDMYSLLYLRYKT